MTTTIISAINKPGILKKTIQLATVRFHICLNDGNRTLVEKGYRDVERELHRLENLLTGYNPNNAINSINRAAGLYPVQVEKEVFDVISGALLMSRYTQGAYSITHTSAEQMLWNFDMSMAPIAELQSIKKLDTYGYRSIAVDDIKSSVYIREKMVRITLRSAWIGSTIDHVVAQLKKLGISNGCIACNGLMYAWGNQPNGARWTLNAINDDAVSVPFANMEVTDSALAINHTPHRSTVNYLRATTHTGADMLSNTPRSAAVLHTSAEKAFALATALLKLDTSKGLLLAAQMPLTSSLVIDTHNQLHTAGPMTIAA